MGGVNKMNILKYNKTVISNTVILTGVLALCACSSISTKVPQVSPEGMTLAKNNRSTVAYKREGINFTDYDKIQISSSTVAFKKDWQRDYNRDQRSLSTRVSDKDVIRIKADVAQLFDQTLLDEFTQNSNYVMVEQVVAGTLLLKPLIIDLDINAPDVRSAANVKNYVQTAGEATLFLELYDAVSGEILARIIDTRKTRDRGYYQWATKVSNRQDAKIIIKKWAKSLRIKFDEAHAK